MTTTAQPETRTPEEIDRALNAFADGFCFGRRAPVLRTPAEHGLEFETVTFPSADGVPLEGWYIPAPGSDKLIIANHPRGFSRSGLPADQQPWQMDWSLSGNGFDVDLTPDYRILHDAGYNVLTYDLRNHGLSSAGNGGIITGGIFERRDVLGSLEYVRSREDTRDMTLGLFSRCMGAAATFAAMSEWPDAFEGIRCMVAPEPVTPGYIVRRRLGRMGLADHFDTFNSYVRLRTSVGIEDCVPQEWAKSVRLPTFLYSVKDDILTDPEDVQAMYDNISTDDKSLLWVEDTTRRFDGYLEFQRRPQPALDWFARWMA